MNRLWVALGAYALIAVLAWMTLTAAIPGTQFQVRHIVLVVLGGLAVSTWIHRRDRDSRNSDDAGNEGPR